MIDITNTTAIILAGGNSRRMGREKALLKIGSCSLIEHIYNQLNCYFSQILISSNNEERYSFLGAEVIKDKIPDSGPLAGITSALEVSESEVNFVIACDIPDVNLFFIKKMIDEAVGFDGVVPVNNKSQYEPLYAVYKKSMITAMNKVLVSGHKRISDVFKLCRIKFIRIEDLHWLKNLNTYKDYEEYLLEKKDILAE